MLCSRYVSFSIRDSYITNVSLFYIVVWKKVYQNASLTVASPLSGKLRRKDRLTPPIRGAKLSDRVSNVLLLSTQFACEALISCERQLNIIDSEICK